ncbi:serine/threonine-protein kinase [Nocardia salmonicida]|uniref:serine/threonine-protein kinase n=1 Tax=Nocardia salmonicida TaxID=53431 RepID=UPI0007A375AC|nr:serine/threonine-protein kinase [Nocardia salmonicida]
MALRPGAIVGGYRVIKVLGAGGMGTVYLAQNPSLPRRDALKVLSGDLSTGPEFRGRFEREANLAAGLDHPNIVAVYNRGDEDGQLWIAMQYVDGTDASAEVAKGPAVMPPHRALRIIGEVGKGLDYAHRRGLLHRDIKPANFMIAAAEDGDEERVLLTDFGVAKSADDHQELTATGNIMATIAYAPPEQLLGSKVDHRADIYSLGCSLYKLLTGQNPYPATVSAMVMMGHLHEPPPRATAVRPDLPPAIDRVIAKVMAKDPAQRYATCREFIQDAHSALFGGSMQAPASQGFNTLPRPAVASTVTAATDVVPPHWTDPSRPVATYQPPGGGVSEKDLVTARNPTPYRTNRARKLLLPSIIGLVVAVLVGTGVFVLTRPDGGAANAGDPLAQVRADHPEFAGKSVTAFNFGNSTLSVVLNPSDQSKFLRDIDFDYNPEYKAVGDEKSPRALSVSDHSLKNNTDVVIVLRTDSQAGNGGFRGLPYSLTGGNAKIVVIDDPSTVQAFQVWSNQSQATLIDKIVPAISKALE